MIQTGKVHVMSRFDDYPKKLVTRINNGKIIEQRYYSFIKELNSFSEERLNSEALVCGKNRFTYSKMFDEWDKFAGIFSALGITGNNNSRIGLMTSFSSDCINMFYAADITGASVSMIQVMDMLDHDRYKNAVEKEGITDLILSSEEVKPGLLRYIMDTRDELSIKNVIVYYAFKDCENRPAGKDEQYRRLKRINGVLFLDELVKEYKDAEIISAPNKSSDAAVIFHTSGTTSGIHKPVPLSDSAYNESAARLLRDERFNELNSYRTFMSIAPFSSYSACDMLHLPLAYGGTVVIPVTHVSDPATFKMIIDEKIAILFAGSFTIEMIMKAPVNPDLSSLELLFLGGSYVPLEKKQRIYKYLRAHGSDAGIYIGYGLTEAGGAVFLTDRDSKNDELGSALPGVNVKILDDETGTYHDIDDGAKTGALCISTKSLSTGKLNDINVFELLEIDGEKYLNTYDLVDVDDKGHIRTIGRMNKYFVNNDGIRFDAGMVETAISSKPGREACGLVPYFNNLVHDTLPVMYVIPDEKGARGLKAVKDAFVSAFVVDGKFADSNLPSKLIITDKLPYTETGKIDVYAILKNKELYDGENYEIKAIKKGDTLVGVKLIHLEGFHRVIGGGIPEELAHDAEMIKRTGALAGNFSAESPLIPGGKRPVKMIRNMIKSGMIEPEMIGAMLARKLTNSCLRRRPGKRNRRHDTCYRGFRGSCYYKRPGTGE